MDSFIDSLSDEDEIYPSNNESASKTIQKPVHSNNSKFEHKNESNFSNQKDSVPKHIRDNYAKKQYNNFHFYQKSNKPQTGPNPAQAKPLPRDPLSYNPETYEIIKPKILNCFNDGVLIPIMNFSIIYTERFSTMFDFKNGGCLKGKFHGHKTVKKYFSCCIDSFELIIGKCDYIKRRDKESSEKIKKRIDNHIHKVSKSSPDRPIHLEILIVSMFSAKTTVTVEDLQMLFSSVYNLKLSSLLPPNREVVKSLQLMNTLNMRVSITSKAANIICVPPSHEEFHDYSEKTDAYTRVLEIEEQICRPKFVPIYESDSQEVDEKSVNMPLVDLLKQLKVEENDAKRIKHEDDKDKIDLVHLSELAALNIPRSIQKTELTFPSSSSLYKQVSDESFLYYLQSLKFDEDEAGLLTHHQKIDRFKELSKKNSNL